MVITTANLTHKRFNSAWTEKYPEDQWRNALRAPAPAPRGAAGTYKVDQILVFYLDIYKSEAFVPT